MKICPEFNCPRREACKESPKSHALPHDHNRFCDKGCELQSEGGRNYQKHPCVSR
jgi:hypothetical protein